MNDAVIPLMIERVIRRVVVVCNQPKLILALNAVQILLVVYISIKNNEQCCWSYYLIFIFILR